ncbi:glycosyltransferase [Oenococcus oeni]|uniref:Glycosyltransferase n=1 Tax=Oenococcus oeni TaxID=1247 RepID=A0AAJ2P2L9_OENOE|nr:glycosyltransferase [Oenococcus oeni]MDV7714401.1 glycosyltransferase [Oenococcus oeni]
MKISVVVATYNGEEFIKDQLQSIVNQSVRPDEIVITDDGSSDQTLDILHDFSKNMSDDIKVRIISNNSEHGFVKNFLNGIFNSTGDIVFLSDQDDIWKKNKINEHLSIYKHHSDAVAIHGEIDVVDRNLNILNAGTQRYRYTGKWDFNHFMKKPNYPGMSLSFKAGKVTDKLKEIDGLRWEIRTHDFLIVLIAEILNGLYVTKQVLNFRRFTGHNVALKGHKDPLTIKKRISSVETFIYQYKLSKETFELILGDNKRINEISKYELVQAKRLLFLKTGNIKYLTYLFFHINLLSSYKPILGDTLSFLRKG